ncbi:MAG: hypothetical protein V1865_00550 [bacterium]
MTTEENQESNIFFQYGIIYYNHGKLAIHLTNSEELLNNFLKEKGGAIKGIKKLENKDEAEALKLEIDRINNQEKNII